MKVTTTETAATGSAGSSQKHGLEEAFELAPSFLAILRGPNHEFERVNRAYIELVGERDLIGRTVADALPEVVEQGLIDILDGVFRTGAPFVAAEFPVQLQRTAGGGNEKRYVSLVYHPLRTASGSIDGIAAHGVDVTDQVRAREALQDREAYFRGLIENSDDKISVLAPEGRILYESPASLRLLGWAEDEMIGRNALEFVHPDDQEGALRHLAAAVAEPGSPRRFEHRLLHRDGSWLTFETVGQARMRGDTLEIVINSRDVTARRAGEAELREREERFRALVELIPQLVWSTTPDGYHDYFNQRWHDYTGMTRSDGQGWNWKDYLHPDDYERSIAVWHRSLETGEPYEIEYRFRRASDGAYRWFIGRALPLRGDDGEIVRWFGTCTDVHDERMALETARANQERFEAVTRATNDVIWDWDVLTGSHWWNENLERVLRLDPSQLSHSIEDWIDRIHPDDRERVTLGFQAAIDDGLHTWSDEYRFLRGDGTVARILDRGRMIRDSSGDPVRLVGSMIDLTERQRLEEELRQAHKMEAIGKLAGGIAHDFNNLLTVITSYVELVLAQLPEGGEIRSEIEEIGKAASRAASLTRQLLAFGRRQVLQPRVLDLNGVVVDMKKMLQRVIGEDIELVLQTGTALPPVFADPGQIEQVIVNLALNARDAMSEGGTLTLSTDRMRLDSAQGRQSGAAPGEYVGLIVRDTGTGMDAATLENAFEPFFTTKAEGHGTGLGLSTVDGIVRQSEGFIEVESEPGKGATFRVFLPVAGPEQKVETPPPAPVPAHRGSGIILVVEDESAVRGVAAKVLARYGYEVVEACNGADAWAALEQSDGSVDLVLTDLLMPEMSGLELAERIRSLSRPPQVLFMSGYAEADKLPGEAVDSRARFLEKPFRVDQLVNAVGGLL